MNEFLDNLLPLLGDMEGYVPRLVGELFIELFPLPNELKDHMDLRKNPEKFRTWFRENEDALSWSEDEGKFAFKR